MIKNKFKNYLIISILFSLTPISISRAANGPYYEFKPEAAVFVPAGQKNTKQVVQKQTVSQPKKINNNQNQLSSNAAMQNEIRGVVIDVVEALQRQGLIKGEKGDKGDKGEPGQPASVSSLPTYNFDIGGMQPVFQPMTYVADEGMFFSADHLSGDELTVESAEIGELSVESGIEVGEDLSVEGESNLKVINATELFIDIITSSSGAYLSSGGDWVNASSKELKTNLLEVDSQDILLKIDKLPIYTWNYKTQDNDVIHMSPMAEDFNALFGLGGTENTKSISTVDPSGVALAAIQGLNKKLGEISKTSWFETGLKLVGLEYKDGVLSGSKISVDELSAKKLEVGSSESPIGFTIYDRVSGQPVCVFSENSILKSEPGKCQAVGSQIVVTTPDIPETQTQKAEEKVESPHIESPKEQTVEVKEDSSSNEIKEQADLTLLNKDIE